MAAQPQVVRVLIPGLRTGQGDSPDDTRRLGRALTERLLRVLPASLLCLLCLLLPVVGLGQPPSTVHLPDEGTDSFRGEVDPAEEMAGVQLVTQRSRESGADRAPDSAAPPVQSLAVSPNATAVVHGRIDDGKRISLRWAETGAMACWPGTRNQHYDGHHVLYTTTLPPRSEMWIELHPEPQVDLSLYAYSTRMSGPLPLPPRVRSAVSCEASHLYGIRTFSVRENLGGVEKVRLRASRNPYRVVIGVAGARASSKGAFHLKVHLKSH